MLQSLAIKSIAIFGKYIHHVEHHNDRYTKVNNLGYQQQMPFELVDIGHIHHQIGKRIIVGITKYLANEFFIFELGNKL